jgi:hypothetical protein
MAWTPQTSEEKKLFGKGIALNAPENVLADKDILTGWISGKEPNQGTHIQFL